MAQENLLGDRLLSKNLWQQSKEGELGALTRAVAGGWEERREKKMLWKE